MIGTILGNRYEIIEKIGEGGMAKVYKARCNKLDRFVAIKVLKEEYLNDKDFVEKFKGEGRAVGSLSHNNIINIYDVGTEGSINYIVMEYVKGKTLKQIIKEEGRLPYEKAIDMSIEICKALDYAHRNNIIHRDVKPHNILVTEDGVVKVTDFGIAKATNSSTITNTNKVVGSAHYFSPEQAKGSYIDCRTDIYSLGIVMYEMVTGRVPYEADSPVLVALKHIQEPPVPPKELNESIPESLNKLIMKTMEKEPIKRYQSAKDMLLDLRRIKTNSNCNIYTDNYEEEFTRVMNPVNLNASQEENNEEIDYKKRFDPKKKKLIIISIIAVCFIAIGVILAVKATSKKQPLSNNTILKDERKIPNIVGLSLDEAKKVLSDNNLKLVVAGREKSSEKEDTIIRCYPEVGTSVKVDSEVRVFVSGGAESLTVPDLTNTDINTVKDVLKSNDLALGDVTYEYSDTVLKGMIIRQSPEIDTQVSKGMKINLVVSNGPEYKLTSVPNLEGLTLDEARRLLESKKLKLGKVSPVETSNVSFKDKNGRINNQSIEANVEVKEGETINVSYYVYKETKKMITIPDFTNTSQFVNGSDVLNWGVENGISIKVVGSPDDTVVSQSVKAGDKMQEGSVVTITTQKKEGGQ